MSTYNKDIIIIIIIIIYINIYKLFACVILSIIYYVTASFWFQYIWRVSSSDVNNVGYVAK